MRNRTLKKVALSVLILLVVVLSYSGTVNRFVLQTPFVNSIDVRAEEYYNESIKKALYTFAVARGLNAIISVIQNIEITPVVATLPLGEILDPLNDLVERFSLVMLVSASSLGIQKILMEIGSWLGFKLLLSLSLLVILIALWLPEERKSGTLALGYKLILVSIVIRFCIPVVGVATSKTYDLFLKEKAEKATEEIEKTRDEIEAAQIAEQDELRSPTKHENADESADHGLWGRIKAMYSGAKDYADIQGKLDSIKQTVSETAKYIVNLIVVFFLQTIIIPLVVLWVILRAGYGLAGRSFTRGRLHGT